MIIWYIILMIDVVPSVFRLLHLVDTVGIIMKILAMESKVMFCDFVSSKRSILVAEIMNCLITLCIRLADLYV